MYFSAGLLLTAILTLASALDQLNHAPIIPKSFHHKQVNISIVVFGRTGVPGTSSLSISEPPLEAAVENLNQRYGQKFVFTYTRSTAHPCLSSCMTSEDVLARWYYQLLSPERGVVFITPGAPGGCDGNGVSIYELGANWNTLMLNTNSGIDSAQLTTLHTTLSLASVDPISYVAFVENVIRKYDWRSVFIVWDPASAPMYRSVGSALAATLAAKGRRTVTSYPLASDSDIMFFFAHATKVRRLMIAASMLNMTDGEFVYIALEVMAAASLFGNLTWHSFTDHDHDEVAQIAFRCLLVLRPLHSGFRASARTDALARDFRERSLRNFNTTYPDGDDLLPILMGSYTAVMLLGQVLNETWASKQDAKDGRRVASMFENRTFHTNIGEVFVDSRGTRVESQAVAHFTSASDVPEPFLVQYRDTPNYLTILKQPIVWPGVGGWPPPSEPFCGYRGDNVACRVTGYSGTTVGIIVGCCTGLGAVLMLFVSWMKPQKTERRWWIMEYRDLVKHARTPNEAGSADVIKSSAERLAQRPLHDFRVAWEYRLR